MEILLNNFNLGGIADSPYQGVSYSMADMQNIDLHSDIGVISVNQGIKIELITSSAIVAIVACSDGKIYFFKRNGEIYKKENEEYILFKNINKTIYDAKEFDGYVYFSTTTHIWRWKVGTNNFEIDFGEFVNKDNEYHPLYVLNLILYVGDGNMVAQMEDTDWTNNALDLPKWLKIKCLGWAGTDLIIWTTINNGEEKSEIFRWNTWSESWTISDEIPEVWVNAILQTDNSILVQAGEKWNIYAYNGQYLERHKRIPWDYRKQTITLKHNASVNNNGIPLFALGNIVYSYWSYSSNYPVVLNKEYILNSDIWCMKIINNTLYIGTENGVYIVDKTQKANKAIIVSRIIENNRELRKNGKITVGYKNLPDWCDIKVYISEAGEEYRELEAIIDKKRKIIETKVAIEFGVYFQVKVELITNKNNSPEINNIIIVLK